MKVSQQQQKKLMEKLVGNGRYMISLDMVQNSCKNPQYEELHGSEVKYIFSFFSSLNKAASWVKIYS